MHYGSGGLQWIDPAILPRVQICHEGSHWAPTHDWVSVSDCTYTHIQAYLFSWTNAGECLSKIDLIDWYRHAYSDVVKSASSKKPTQTFDSLPAEKYGSAEGSDDASFYAELDIDALEYVSRHPPPNESDPPSLCLFCQREQIDFHWKSDEDSCSRSDES